MAKEVYELEPLAGSSLNKARKPVNYRPIPTRRTVHFKNEIPIWVFILLVVACISLFFLSYGLFLRLPRGLRIVDEEHFPNRFIAERAAGHIKNLTDIGDRVAGSMNNEVYAMNLILSNIDKIREEAHPSNFIEVNPRIGNGSYYRDKRVYPQMNVYYGIQNIVVKLDKKTKPTQSDTDTDNYILLNSHIDTVVMSPGAGDDATMVGVMLEVLRVLAKQENSFKHGIIFLFNGCEETELQGSHAFISTDPWFEKCRALINLDAGGIGGKEMLFRTTANQPWIMKTYSKAAPHAMASTIAEEIFGYGLIQSDTDFRNFRMYGKSLAGIDCAQNTNGYIYHTKYDDFNLISLGSLQHTGDNVVAVISEIEESNEMAGIDEPIEEVQQGFIFYDLLGFAFVFYSGRDGLIVNLVVTVALLLVIGICLFYIARKEKVSTMRITFEFLITLVIQIIAIIAASFSVFLLAILYDISGRPLSWFWSNWLIFFIYFCPFILILSLVPWLYIKWRERNHETTSYFVQLNLHAHCVVLLIILVVMTFQGIRSSFVLMLTGLIYLVTTTFNVALRLYNNGFKWVYIHLAGQMLPVLFYFYMAVMGYMVLIPTTGRAYDGGHRNPEIVVAFLTMSIGYLSMGFITPLFNLFKYRRYIYLTLCSCFALGLIFMVTPLGFPFREAVAAQRFTVWHTERSFYHFDNTLKRRDVGYYVHTYDRLGSKTIKNIVPEMRNATSLAPNCETDLFCGFPFYLGVYHGNVDHSSWIPLPFESRPKFPRTPTLRLQAKFKRLETTRYTFVLNGPSRMSLHLSALEGAKITSWTTHGSTEENPPAKLTWKGRDMYFINFTTGKREYQWKDITFSVDIEIPFMWNRQHVMDIGFSAHFLHDDKSHTDEFKQFVNSFPSWTNVQHWTAFYEGHQF